MERPWRASIDHRVVFSLTLVVALSVSGIIIVSVFTLAIQGGIFGSNPEGTEGFRVGDEIVSVLGQISSAGMGALAGYFTARVIEKRHGVDIEVDDD